MGLEAPRKPTGCKIKPRNSQASVSEAKQICTACLSERLHEGLAALAVLHTRSCKLNAPLGGRGWAEGWGFAALVPVSTSWASS